MFSMNIWNTRQSDHGGHRHRIPSHWSSNNEGPTTKCCLTI